MNKNRLKVKIIIRRFPEGDLIALFPEYAESRFGDMTSYQVIGQHGAASYDLMRYTLPVDYGLQDVQDLLSELRSIYDDCTLVLCKRIGAAMLFNRWSSIRLDYSEV